MEYQCRLTRPNGILYLNRFEHFTSDECAVAAALAMLAPANGELRLEVWRDEECIYDGAAYWSFRQNNVVRFPHRATKRDNDQSRRP